MGPTWGPSGADRTQVGPMLAQWTLLSGIIVAVISVTEQSWYWMISMNYFHVPLPFISVDDITVWVLLNQSYTFKFHVESNHAIFVNQVPFYSMRWQLTVHFCPYRLSSTGWFITVVFDLRLVESRVFMDHLLSSYQKMEYFHIGLMEWEAPYVVLNRHAPLPFKYVDR